MDRTVIWVGIKSEHKITRKILLGKIILFTIIYSLVEKKLLCLDGYNTKLTEIEIDACKTMKMHKLSEAFSHLGYAFMP